MFGFKHKIGTSMHIFIDVNSIRMTCFGCQAILSLTLIGACEVSGKNSLVHKNTVSFEMSCRTLKFSKENERVYCRLHRMNKVPYQMRNCI